MNSKHAARFRLPSAEEQPILLRLAVRLVRPAEVPNLAQLLTQHHYLRSAQRVGAHRRQVAAGRGQWLTLAAWNASALRLQSSRALPGNLTIPA